MKERTKSLALRVRVEKGLTVVGSINPASTAAIRWTSFSLITFRIFLLVLHHDVDVMNAVVVRKVWEEARLVGPSEFWTNAAIGAYSEQIGMSAY